VELDQVFGLTPGAVERVVDPLGTAVLERGDDEADVEAQARGDCQEFRVRAGG